MACIPYNGTATATPSSGVPPYTYEWRKGGVVVGTTQTIDNLSAGKYICVITDSIGCEAIAEYDVLSTYVDSGHIIRRLTSLYVSATSNNKIYKYKDADSINYDHIIDETDNNFTANDYTAPKGMAYVPDIDGLGNSGFIVVSKVDNKAVLYGSNWKMIGVRTYSDTSLEPNDVTVDTDNNQYLFLSTKNKTVAVADVVQAFNNSTITIEDESLTLSVNTLQSLDYSPRRDKVYVSGFTASGTKTIESLTVAEGSLGSPLIVVTDTSGASGFGGLRMNADEDKVFVVDIDNDVIKRYSLTGTLELQVAIPSAVTPFDIEIDASNYYVTDSGLVGVHKIAI